MSILDNYQDPVIYRMRKGNSDDPYFPINQVDKVRNNKIQLKEIPDKFQSLTIKNETDTLNIISEGIPSQDDVLVDWTNGILLFDDLNEGKTYTIEFYGRGIVFMPSSRVYTQTDENGEVTEVLQQLTDSTSIAKNEANTAATLANEKANLAQEKANAAQTAATNTQAIVDETKFVEPYNTTTTYKKNNIVSLNGNSYMAKRQTKGNTPTDSPSDPNWSLVARKGNDGTGTVTTHRDVFEATEGQKVFNLQYTYDQFQYRTKVTIGGVPQKWPDNYEETTNQSITFTEGLPAGTEVIVDYFSESIPLQSDIQTTVSNHSGVLSNHATKLNNTESELTKVTSQLAEKSNEITTIQTEKMDKATTDISVLQINKNYGLLDETYFSDEVKQQWTGNTPVNSVPPDDSLTTVKFVDGAVTAKKLAFKVPEGTTSKNKNLFNKLNITRGYYVSYTDGQLKALATYGVSEYIPVAPNTKYYFTVNSQKAFYDSNKVFISGVDATNAFTTPANAAFVRVSFLLSGLETLQLELGSSATSYESGTPKLESSRIIGLEFTPVQSDIKTKNLFNKLKAIKNRYIPYTHGNLSGNIEGFYASDFIELEPSTAYTKNEDKQFAYYDVNKMYISGVPDGTKTFTTPSNCRYARFTITSAKVDKFQLEKGSTETEFQSGLPQIYKEQVLGLATGSSYKNIIVVAKENGDYPTILEAVNNANDNVDNPVTVLVMPGTYEESIDLLGRYISIVGVNKKTCVLVNHSGDYYTPPLNIGMNNHIMNMTIKSTHEKATIDSYTIPSYAIHMDNNSPAGDLLIKNCLLESHQHAAIGIGLRDQQKVILEDCELIKRVFDDGFTKHMNGSLYAHNYQLSGATNQQLIVKNCHIVTDDGEALSLQDANHRPGGNADDARDTVFSFYNNVVWSKTLGKTNIIKKDAPLESGRLSGYISLGGDSFGNNLPELNA